MRELVRLQQWYSRLAAGNGDSEIYYIISTDSEDL